VDRPASAALRASALRVADARRPAKMAEPTGVSSPDEVEGQRRGVEVLAALLVAHRAELLAFVERRASGHVSAEDVVQKVALRALRGAHQLRHAHSGRAWLFKITRHVLAEEFRGSQPSSASALGTDAATETIPEFGCGCVAANVQHLRPDHAAILTQVAVDGVSLIEVASELGISVNAATVRLHRARGALKERLRSHCGTTSLRACLDCACVERSCCS